MTNADLSQIDFTKCKLPDITITDEPRLVTSVFSGGVLTILAPSTAVRYPVNLASKSNGYWRAMIDGTVEQLTNIVAMCKTVDEFIERAQMVWAVDESQIGRRCYNIPGKKYDVEYHRLELAKALLERCGQVLVREVDGGLHVDGYTVSCKRVKK
jgi:hypothetical protein